MTTAVMIIDRKIAKKRIIANKQMFNFSRYWKVSVGRKKYARTNWKHVIANPVDHIVKSHFASFVLRVSLKCFSLFTAF
jgi:hypothetical protein